LTNKEDFGSFSYCLTAEMTPECKQLILFVRENLRLRIENAMLKEQLERAIAEREMADTGWAATLDRIHNTPETVTLGGITFTVKKGESQ